MDAELIQFYEFGHFRIDIRRRLLSRNREPVPLPPKVFDLLLVLVQNSGQELKKDELMNILWPDSFVEEGNLTQKIFLLRNALGQDQNKNRFIITIPGRGYRFVAEVKHVAAERVDLPGWQSNRLLQVREGPRTKCVAVLPFKSVGPEAADDYLGLGMADLLITRLSHIQQITVRPTNAILKYTDPTQYLLAIGRELGVDALVDGRIQTSGKIIRATVQLIDVRDGSLLWADKFEENFTSIFAVQDSICEQVGRALTLKLSDEERERLTKHHTESTDAYHSYLKGRYHSMKWTENGWKKSIEYFEQAIEIDPNYALAYSGLADSYYIVSNLYLPPHEAMPRINVAANKALELDDTLAEAHVSLALVRAFYDWNWPKAETEFRRAIELNPGYALSYQWYGRHLAAMGQFEAALGELRQAQELDPLSPSISTELARIYFLARKANQAIAQSEETLDLDPHFWPAHLFLGLAYEQRQQYTEAISELEKARWLDDNPRTTGTLAHAYAVAGYRAEAQSLLDELNDRSTKQYVSPYYIATIYTGLGEKDLAFLWFDRAYQDRAEWLVWIKGDSRLDNLRSDPRFAGLLRRVGFY